MLDYNAMREKLKSLFDEDDQNLLEEERDNQISY